MRREGYLVEHSATGAGALAALHAGSFELVVLDLMLPDADGLQICRDIRRIEPGLPVLILTARADEVDIVVGLDAGADDYLTKPFRLAELLARMRALRRRTSAPTELNVADLRIDAAGRQAWARGDLLDLSAKEFDLLVVLAGNAGGVVDRRQIVREVWDSSVPETSRTVDTHISSLRRKLADRTHPVARLSTVRGVGFRLDPL